MAGIHRPSLNELRGPSGTLYVENQLQSCIQDRIRYKYQCVPATKRDRNHNIAILHHIYYQQKFSELRQLLRQVIVKYRTILDREKAEEDRRRNEEDARRVAFNQKYSEGEVNTGDSLADLQQGEYTTVIRSRARSSRRPSFVRNRYLGTARSQGREHRSE